MYMSLLYSFSGPIRTKEIEMLHQDHWKFKCIYQQYNVKYPHIQAMRTMDIKGVLYRGSYMSAHVLCLLNCRKSDKMRRLSSF